MNAQLWRLQQQIDCDGVAVVTKQQPLGVGGCMSRLIRYNAGLQQLPCWGSLRLEQHNIGPGMGCATILCVLLFG